jgi:hypothetical protein
MAVPVAQFDAVRAALAGLGESLSERVSSEVSAAGSGANLWNTFSDITVFLRPAPGLALPRFEARGWNPTRTFERAFRFFYSIFAFLADIVIWVAVVAGPFLLLGLGARWITRRLRAR